MKKNGTTTAGTTRWRCTGPSCGASTVTSYANATTRRHFGYFIDWVTGTASLSTIAATHNLSRRTLTRWFTNFWFIQIPDNTDHNRVYDQVFIDGTYFHKKCLLVASSIDHVIAWHWCTQEDSFNYGRLFDQIAEPLIVTTDGQAGAIKAIKKHWPNARIQRCLVHVKRNIQGYVTLRPNTAAGKALRRLSLTLLQVTTPEDAATWTIQLQRFHDQFADWLAQRTYRDEVASDAVPAFARTNKSWWYTHYRQRSAYRLLERLYKADQLFVYITPPTGCSAVKSTTNSLEGGINAQLKNLARAHRGTFDEHQRIIMDWWLYLHTQLHDDPDTIARHQGYGTTGRTTAQQVITTEREHAHGPATGGPKGYDTAIESTPTPSMGIRKGWAGRG